MGINQQDLSEEKLRRLFDAWHPDGWMEFRVPKEQGSTMTWESPLDVGRLQNITRHVAMHAMVMWA